MTTHYLTLLPVLVLAGNRQSLGLDHALLPASRPMPLSLGPLPTTRSCLAPESDSPASPFMTNMSEWRSRIATGASACCWRPGALTLGLEIGGKLVLVEVVEGTPVFCGADAAAAIQTTSNVL
jgi:hypothetical protein